MTDPTGMTGASLVTFFSRLGPDELPRAYAELVRGLERAANAAEVEQQAQDITQLLGALKTEDAVTAEQVLAMDAELRQALHAARRRLGDDAMSGPNNNDPFAGLHLPPAVQAQALKLLARIQQAHSADELWRAGDRAEGFVLGLETVKVLNAASIEGLYVAFDNAATARRLEQEQ